MSSRSTETNRYKKQKLSDDERRVLWEVLDLFNPLFTQENHETEVSDDMLRREVQDVMYLAEEYPLSGCVLSRADLDDLLPDATHDEMIDIADMVAEGLMESWQECLEYAVNNIKADRRMNNVKD